jgi:hypothetical protein
VENDNKTTAFQKVLFTHTHTHVQSVCRNDAGDYTLVRGFAAFSGRGIIRSSSEQFETPVALQWVSLLRRFLLFVWKENVEIEQVEVEGVDSRIN